MPQILHSPPPGMKVQVMDQIPAGNNDFEAQGTDGFVLSSSGPGLATILRTRRPDASGTITQDVLVDVPIARLDQASASPCFVPV